jgi:predicted transposase/invertase (TIGR01784 family)
LRPVLALNILQYRHFTEDDDALRIFRLYDDERHKKFPVDYLRLAYFEFTKKNIETVNQRHWRDYFTRGEVSASAPDYIRKAARIIEVVNLTKGEREMISLEEKALSNFQSERATAIHDARDAGRVEGRVEGRNEGRNEGIVIGATRARNEMLAIFLRNGTAPEELAKITGLPVAEIIKLM